MNELSLSVNATALRLESKHDEESFQIAYPPPLLTIPATLARRAVLVSYVGTRIDLFYEFSLARPRSIGDLLEICKRCRSNCYLGKSGCGDSRLAQLNISVSYYPFHFNLIQDFVFPFSTFISFTFFALC